MGDRGKRRRNITQKHGGAKDGAGVKRLEMEHVDGVLDESSDGDDDDHSDGESDGVLDFLERLGGGGDPYIDDGGDCVFDPSDCDY